MRQVVRRQPVLSVRWQQERLITAERNELRHAERICRSQAHCEADRLLAPDLRDGHHVTFILPIIILKAEEEVKQLTASRPDARAHMARAHHLPKAFCAIRDYRQARRPNSA
ncbi:hypothetical protein J8J14_13830 [Roseomonas sp. SSH11]|uniref:Uncharacterized protein n=1 Tax=Pararoseomonas baculiformis TaxID=2820812 RepID=A0ABS4AI14_9PROT|nr:hypothetical protein [Pararoseomonas baculiformis]MBP0445854.1 hypothetical protein [Pararoseomonas baculiformis]